MVVLTYNASTQEAHSGRLWIQGQSVLHNKTLPKKKQPKIEQKKNHIILKA